MEELSLEAAMERLNERERYIITLRFFEGKTQMEVAEEVQNIPGSGEPAGEKCAQGHETVSAGLK